MRAAVVEQFGGDVSLRSVDDLEAGPGQVVIDVHACGVCRTDVMAVQGQLPSSRLPFIPGHEVVGRVRSVGRGVTHLAHDSRVAVGWLGWACGRCHWCRTGAEVLCPQRKNTGSDIDGGFAEQMVVDADFAVPVPASVDTLDAACLACAGASALRAVRGAGVGIGDLTAIFGVGGVGHMALQYARLAGATVAAIDTSPEKLEVARMLGSRLAIDACSGDPVAELHHAGGAAQAIVTTGAPTAVGQALRSLRPGGTLVLVGMHRGASVELPVDESIRGELRVQGSIGATRTDLADAMTLHQLGRTRTLHHARGLSDVPHLLAQPDADGLAARLVVELR